MPYDCDRIMAIADKYGIPVVEDAAEGFGSRYKGQVLGTFGKFGVLSFNGNKMITTSGAVPCYAAMRRIVCKELDELSCIAQTFDDMKIVGKMKQIVPEYKSQHSKYQALDK